MLRFISLALRKIQAAKKEEKLLKTFYKWQAELTQLPQLTSAKKILVIRLDDIGDYILFRNFLGAYKLSQRWKDYEITLLANIAWKDLFDAYDKDKVDNVIWIDKRKYFSDEVYRKNVWNELRNKRFEIVINSMLTRPLLLDDICALATGAARKIGYKNANKYVIWNKASDILYNELFFLKDAYTHEFIFNKKFAEWCCAVDINIDAPQFEEIDKKRSGNHLVFFIGASAKSKRWTVKRWNDLIELMSKNFAGEIFICGGKEDIERAAKIIQKSNVENITGKTSLMQMIELINNAKAVVTNDTMAAHAAVACKTPVVIITGGDNYYRFIDYSSLHVENFAAVIPEIFLKNKKKQPFNVLHYETVSADIASIKAREVFEALRKVLP